MKQNMRISLKKLFCSFFGHDILQVYWLGKDKATVSELIDEFFHFIDFSDLEICSLGKLNLHQILIEMIWKAKISLKVIQNCLFAN